MKHILKLLATLTIFTTMTLAQASTVNWEIIFFNENGNIVGDGEFSYDPDTLVSFSTQSPNPSDIPMRTSVNTSFTNLNWRFGGNQLWNTNSARFAWWDGGSLISTRDGSYFGPLILGESQDFSGGSFRDSFIRLGFDQTNTDFSATGSWEQNRNLTIGDFSGSGTWSANALVPIPSTILLFGSGLLALTMTKRKKFRN